MARILPPRAIARESLRKHDPRFRYELALDEMPPRRTRTIEVGEPAKDVFDELQAWYFVQTGRRVTHWELFDLLLADAIENPLGRFRAWKSSRSTD